ncbi:jg14969 [Pararge aegeria aegeria]|uniref:Jg14969 protein n=1 Tax=Pararge aegeria aegeria TaxID=348720 RepID=A0A8S4SC87_9NEOP|nr:jg14969 [Pararge aegeria aegeria]
MITRFSYLHLLACSALLTAPPNNDEVACDSFRVSTHVASYTSDLPSLHGARTYHQKLSDQSVIVLIRRSIKLLKNGSNR